MVDDGLEKIIALLHAKGICDCGRVNDIKDIIIVTVSCEFEPHGRASETWEIIYRLAIPRIHSYLLMLDGWKMHENKEWYWECQGRTLENCIEKTVNLLTNANVERRYNVLTDKQA